jgi:hypothetical protein
LARLKDQRLNRWQPQEHLHDIRRQGVQVRDTAGKRLDLNFGHCGDETHIHGEI